jgi:hypothetical protein
MKNQQNVILLQRFPAIQGTRQKIYFRRNAAGSLQDLEVFDLRGHSKMTGDAQACGRMAGNLVGSGSGESASPSYAIASAALCMQAGG